MMATLRGLSGAFIAAMLFSATAYSATTVLPQKRVKILPTKDVTVIAWIRGDVIELPGILDGVDPELILKLNTPGFCSELLAEWLLGFQTNLATDADRRYANGFLIKHSANGQPPQSIDPDAVKAAGDYRVFSRFQVAYRVKDGKIVGEPKYLQAIADIGYTPDPCGVVAPVLAQAHPFNGSKGITTSETGVSLVAQGRVGTFGQAVDTNINAPGSQVGGTTPWIWAATKFDTSGNLVWPFAIGNRANFQIFPTYQVYEDGQLVREVRQGDLHTFISLDADSQIPGQLP